MGSDVHVLVVGRSRRARAAPSDRIEVLESRWSRFRPDSERQPAQPRGRPPVLVSTTPARGRGRGRRVARDRRPLRPDGAPPRSSPRATTATSRSFPGGRHRAAVDIATAGTRMRRDRARPDRRRDHARRPASAIDLGGIGKGLAADLVAAELVARRRGRRVRERRRRPAASGVARRPTPGWIVDVEHLPDVRIALAQRRRSRPARRRSDAGRATASSTTT